MARSPVFLEAQTRNYWLASRALFCGDIDVSRDVAAHHLASLAHYCPHARLRCAAGGALATLGLSRLYVKQSYISALPFGETNGSRRGPGQHEAS